LREWCYLIVDAKQNRNLICGDCRAEYGADSRFGADVHCFRFPSSKGMQARLLREQDVLRDFKKSGASFAAARDKRFGA
jgi:formate-dependent nitrite reductase cytochrome c552 subunit